MLENSISLCMIVKDEEKNIRRCLESVKDFVDEIILVDTGSTDKTVEIAKEYGAKIYFHKWANDFSDARNASLEKATKNWILFLDADEELDPTEGFRLKNILSLNSNLEGFHLRLVNIISNTDIGDAIVLRVFKNRPEYRFEGKMHEQIVGSIERLNGPNFIGATDVKINHYGYDPNFADIEKKQKRNLDLLNSYPEDKRDGYFYYSLGNEYARVENHDKALEIYQKALEIPIKNGERPVYLAYLYLNIAKVLSSSKRYKDEIEKLHEFENNFKNFKDLYFMECLAYIECNKLSEAKMALYKYLQCSEGNYEFPNSHFEKNYNIEEIKQILEENSITCEKDFLSVLILCDKDEPTLIDTIKSVNEISNEVILATPKNSDLNRDTLKNYGATIIDIDSFNREEIFMQASKMCKGKYILLMKPKEVCTVEMQKKLINLILEDINEYFNLLILDTKTNSSTSEFRLYKNSNELRNIDDFSIYLECINKNKIASSQISLQRI